MEIQTCSYIVSLCVYEGTILLGECVISLVLSHCNKNLKQWTDKCYSLVLQLGYRSVLFGQAEENTSSRGVGEPTQKK